MDYQRISLHQEKRILTVTFDNPPINLMDAEMFNDLDRLGRWLETDEELNVVIFRSANPQFFIAHADLEMLDVTYKGMDPVASYPSNHQQIVDRFRTLPQATIACIEGIARGGGSEFVMALDMRFGAIGRAILCQPEVSVGFPPGCGGTQRLPRLVGRSNALEAILGCGDFSAEEAARIGWLNRALPADEIGPFIDRLAARIASFSRPAIVTAKLAIDASTQPMRDGLREELQAFLIAFASDESRRRVAFALQNPLPPEFEAGPIEDLLLAMASPEVG